MSLTINDDEAARMAQELAALTGESLSETVVVALRERLARSRARSESRPLAARLMEIGRRCANLPHQDERSVDEILGYDEHGLPT